MVPCIACQNGDKPTKHFCIDCKKATHIIPGCSESIGDPEGNGERRRCMECAAKKKKPAGKLLYNFYFCFPCYNYCGNYRIY